MSTLPKKTTKKETVKTSKKPLVKAVETPKMNHFFNFKKSKL
jgi:hypothetical protein